MHELLHVSILASTILGAASLALLLLWTSLFDSPMPPLARGVALGVVGAAGALFLVEWQVIH